MTADVVYPTTGRGWSAVSRHYEVTVQGDATPGLVAAFPDMSMTAGAHTTTLAGPLLDEAALIGVIERVQSLGLTILEVHRADNAPESG